MNMGDKTRTVTVRLTQDQFDYLESTAKALEVTPSKFLRMVVNAAMLGSALGSATVVGMEAKLADRQTDRNDLV